MIVCTGMDEATDKKERQLLSFVLVVAPVVGTRLLIRALEKRTSLSRPYTSTYSMPGACT